MLETLIGWLSFFKVTRRADGKQADDAMIDTQNTKESVAESKPTAEDDIYDIDYLMQWHYHERKIVPNDRKKVHGKLNKLVTVEKPIKERIEVWEANVEQLTIIQGQNYLEMLGSTREMKEQLMKLILGLREEMDKLKGGK